MSKQSKPRTKKPQDRQLSFEENLVRLQQIVHELEQGELGLTESLQRYEDGVQRLKQCYQQLSQAEQRVELLSGRTENGQLSVERFDEAAMSLEEKAEARSARRSRRSSKKSTSDSAPRARKDDVDDLPGLF